MRNGIAFRLLPLVPRISAGASSFSPTPRACSGLRSSGANRTELVDFWLPTPTASDRTHGGLIEAMSAIMYPTPMGNDRENSPKKYMRGNQNLAAVAAKIYPSPRADGRDNAGGANSRRTAKANGTYIGRTLNPQFVEWLMGFPIGFTDLEDSGMR